MSLLYINITNFKQTGIAVDQVSTYGLTGENTLPKSVQLSLKEHTNNINPSCNGNEGYFSWGTPNLSISGHLGYHSGQWLTYNDSGAYWTTPGMPLQFTEYDPGGGGNQTTNTPANNYNYSIGHDFWKITLMGTYLGENYTPTPGQPATWYKVWHKPSEMEVSNNLIVDGLTIGDVIQSYNEHWHPFVNKIVAINDRPLDSNGFNEDNIVQFRGAQDNNIIVIVVLEEGITGQQIIDDGNITIDFDGEPTFVEFATPTPPPDPWSGDDSIGENDDGDVWYDNLFNGNDSTSTPDGNDANDFVDSGGSVDIQLDVSFSDSDDTDASNSWGNEGLLEDQIQDDEVNNPSPYDSLAASSSDSVDVDFNENNSDNYSID